MKITKISYAKVFNLGNYSNEKVSIEAEIGPGEKPEEALLMMRQWTELNSSTGKLKLEQARQILATADHYTGIQVANAKELVNTYEMLEKNGFAHQLEEGGPY